MFPALLTTIFFSISVVCGHRSAKLLGGGTEANFWRLTCATIFLGIWAFGFGIGLNGTAFPLFFVSGVLGIGVGDVALFQALPRLGSRLSLLLIQCLTAPLGALIEWLWLGTRVGGVQVVAGLTILAGVGIALAPGKHLKITRRERWAGIAASVIAAAGGAFGAVLSRKAYALLRANGERVDGANAAFQRIVGGLLVGGICLLIVKHRELAGVLMEGRVSRGTPGRWRSAWPWVVLNSLAGQTIGVSCMQWAFATAPTAIVLPIIATTPVVVMPLAAIFEKERITARAVLGGVIAVAGVILMTQAPR